MVPVDFRFFAVGDCTELNWDRPIKLIVPQQRNCKIEVLADWHGYLARKKIIGERQEDDFERALRSVGMVLLMPFPMTKKASRLAEVANPTGMSPIARSDSCLQERNSANC